MQIDAHVIEVAPRDGLQSHPVHYTPLQRAQLVDALVNTGIRHIEAGSFVNPKAIPQMAGSDEVFALINRQQGVVYSALAPNLRGLENALQCSPDEIAIFIASSEGFSQNNTRCSVDESLVRVREVAKEALNAGVKVRGYLSTIIECPYDGLTPVDRVIELSEALIDMGCYEVSLGDTIGKGTPEQFTNLLSALLPSLGVDKIAMHCHDTYGKAIANVVAGLELGIRRFDSSAMGIGGCPYAPGAAGNVATEQLVEVLHSTGLQTGINLEMLKQVTLPNN